MPTLEIEPMPSKNDLIYGKDSLAMSGPWQRWFQVALLPRVQNAAPGLVTVQLTAQGASIGTTSLIALATGVYRINYYVRVTRAATTSSSISVSITGTDGGGVCTQTSAALTGNLVTSTQSGFFLATCDASTPLSYSTTYASVGGTSMQYLLTLVVEGLL
jgi:hypothetical protein